MSEFSPPSPNRNGDSVWVKMLLSPVASLESKSALQSSLGTQRKKPRTLRASRYELDFRICTSVSKSAVRFREKERITPRLSPKKRLFKS